MSAGIDGIPCLLVKNAAVCFVRPLTQLIKCSIRHGIFPSAWRNAKVCPIHKADDPTSVTNYRPISISVFEMYIYDQLLPYVSVTISNAQHGFFAVVQQ
ncbi:GSCOCG00011811001-RA-CDS [Cotesia congregata]|nr:GSCOCG00011811001-RA-CDS [Cotesia congregata]